MAKTVDIRVDFNAEQWKAWQLPTDKSNPAQLRRIVTEWVEQREILATLSTIDDNPSRALGMLLQSHSLMQNAKVVLNVSSVAEPSSTDDLDEDDLDSYAADDEF